MRNPTPQQIADARLAVETLKKHKGNETHAAKALGIARATLQGRLIIADRLAAHDEQSEVVDATVKLRIAEGQVRDLAARIKKMEEESASDADVEARIFGIVQKVIEPPDWLIRPRAGKSITGVPSALWSDWHYGEVVTLAETNGGNAYNMATADRRFRRLIEKTIDLSKNHMTNADYPGIVVNSLGDIVSGEIHAELVETNEDDLFPIIERVVGLKVWGLRQLADAFGRVFYVGTPGNHGRMDKKPRAKGRASRNADWLIHRMVRLMLADDKRFAWLIPPSGDAHYRVYRHRYFATHGDALGVRGGDGIIGAIGPIMRGEIKTANSESQIGRAYDTILMGHWHQMLWLPRAIVNNTMKGYDEFARNFLRAPAAPPSQALWFTHPKWGITARWEILLDDMPNAAGEPWVSAFKEVA